MNHKITYTGSSISAVETFNRTRTLFSRSQRFQHISEQVRKTSYRVGPGSYATPLSTNQGAGPKILKESVIKDDLDYFYVGNVLVKQANVFRPFLMDKTSYSFTGSDGKKALNHSLPTEPQEYSRDYKPVGTHNPRHHATEKVGVRPRRSYLSVDSKKKEINLDDHSPTYFKNNLGEEQKRNGAFEFESNINQNRLSNFIKGARPTNDYNEFIIRKAQKVTTPQN